MGDHADDAIFGGLDENWGWRSGRSRARRKPKPKPSAPATLADFSDLMASPPSPVVESLEDLLEAYGEAYIAEAEYPCGATAAELETAKQAVLARLR